MARCFPFTQTKVCGSCFIPRFGKSAKKPNCFIYFGSIAVSDSPHGWKPTSRRLRSSSCSTTSGREAASSSGRKALANVATLGCVDYILLQVWAGFAVSQSDFLRLLDGEQKIVCFLSCGWGCSFFAGYLRSFFRNIRHKFIQI